MLRRHTNVRTPFRRCCAENGILGGIEVTICDVRSGLTVLTAVGKKICSHGRQAVKMLQPTHGTFLAFHYIINESKEEKGNEVPDVRRRAAAGRHRVGR